MVAKRQLRPRQDPQRTCVACQQKKSKRQLTRLVRVAENQVVVDPSGKQNGRGAYLCDQPSCWEKAIKKRLLDRALKVELSDEARQALWAQRPQATEPGSTPA